MPTRKNNKPCSLIINLHISDFDGNETFVTKGIYPQWAPDSNGLMYLKSDGLYFHNLLTSEDRRIFSLQPEPVSTNNKIDLSRDGTMFAWSDIDNNKVFLFKISSWDPFEIELYKEISATAFWPVFFRGWQVYGYTDHRSNR